ncbi:hypothetical protein ACSVDA_09450 [Cytobacillus sp. Hm23]
MNIIKILLTNPADILVGEPPKLESGKDSESIKQKAINRIVEEMTLLSNDTNSLLAMLTRDAGLRKSYNIREVLSAIRFREIGT